MDMIEIKLPCIIGTKVKVNGENGTVSMFEVRGYSNPFDNMKKLPRVYAVVSQNNEEVLVRCQENGEFPNSVEIIKEGF